MPKKATGRREKVSPLRPEPEIKKELNKQKKQKPVEEAYSLGEKYTEALRRKTLPTDYCRAHIFPKGPFSHILEDNDASAGVGQKNVADKIPYIVLPRGLETQITQDISAFARHASDTGELSLLSGRQGKKSQFAITNDSEFAKQHPDVYLQIMRQKLTKHADGLKDGQKDKFLASIDGAIDKFYQFAQKCGVEGIFAGNLSPRESRTISSGLLEVLQGEDPETRKYKEAFVEWEQYTGKPYEPEEEYHVREAINVVSFAEYLRFSERVQPLSQQVEATTTGDVLITEGAENIFQDEPSFDDDSIAFDALGFLEEEEKDAKSEHDGSVPKKLEEINIYKLIESDNSITR